MTRRKTEPNSTQDDGASASLRLVALPLIYAEDFPTGHNPSTVTLAPCQVCGVAVIAGKLDSGALVMVEPQTCTYALLWPSGEMYPRLTPSRGYPAHQCRPTVGPGKGKPRHA